MIVKMQICIDDKLVWNKFSIIIQDNLISIKLTDNTVQSIIKIPIYNRYNGINYYPICFPLQMPITNNKILNPYIILSSYNLKIPNDIDFFSQLETIFKTHFNLEFDNLNDKLHTHDQNSNSLIKLIDNNYPNVLNLENLKTQDLNVFIWNLWFNVNIIKLCVIYIYLIHDNISNKNIKNITTRHNVTKKIFTVANHIKNFTYPITNISHDNLISFYGYLNYNHKKSLGLSDIKPDNSYYIVINKDTTTEITTSDGNNGKNKVIKITISKIHGNIISLSETKNIIFENYKWYHYHPDIVFNKNYLIFQTFLNESFTKEIIKNIINIDPIHCERIYTYYNQDSKLSNLIVIPSVFPELKTSFDDMNILISNSYTKSFFEYVTQKYTDNDNAIYKILEILFNNYNYPLKQNRHDLDDVFDHIMYFSLCNYKNILSNGKYCGFSNQSIDILDPKVNSVIPGKLKNLYINLLKTTVQIINNEYESITYNQKFYSDYLHKSIIKILNSNSEKLFVKLFKNSLSNSIYSKFKNILNINFMLIDITGKLTWGNLPKKLNYLNVFYKNYEILHYQDKLNKNIISEYFDLRIKKIIENPFEMYRYLRKEKDFIKWTKFISDRIIQIYHVPISLSSDDFVYIGNMIYLLFNIINQDINDQSYVNFINFCNSHNKLVLDSNRINIKIKEYFPNLRTQINLGFLAKHLTWNKSSFSFSDKIIPEEKSDDVLRLEIKLRTATKKYYKYKAKYLESKDTNLLCALGKNKETDTSSIIPNQKYIFTESLYK